MAGVGFFFCLLVDTGEKLTSAMAVVAEEAVALVVVMVAVSAVGNADFIEADVAEVVAKVAVGVVAKVALGVVAGAGGIALASEVSGSSSSCSFSCSWVFSCFSH